MNKKRIVRGFLFYITGLILGCILVYQLWIKNRTDLPNMWPEGRVKDKIIRSKILTDSNAVCYTTCYSLNDSLIKTFVKTGNVRFGISETRRKPYPLYVIDGTIHEGWKIRMKIISEDSTSRINYIEDLPESPHKQNCRCN